MSGSVRATLGVLVGAAALALVAAGSLAPWEAEDASRAVLRLSWRAPAERIEACRPLSPDEIARTPVHMRRPEVCETHFVPYLLRVAVDGRVVLADTLAGAGARADRPVAVFREVAVAPGEREIEIRFEALIAPEDEDDDEHEEEEEEDDGHEEEEGEHREDERIMGPLRLVERIRLAPRGVALVTLDTERRALVLVAREGGAGRAR